MRPAIAAIAAASVVSTIGTATAQSPARGTAPRPTFHATTTAAGVALPVTTAAGRWTEQEEGRRASLNVDLANVAGTRTTATATWTSAPFRLSQFRGVTIRATTNHLGPNEAGLASSYTCGWRVRIVGSRWSRWDEFGRAYAGNPLLLSRSGLGAAGTILWRHDRDPMLTIQVRIHVVSTDTAAEQESWGVDLRT